LALDGVYPTPFGASVTIRFSVPYGSELSRLRLEICNVLGQEVWTKTYEGSELCPGEHLTVWHTTTNRSEPAAAGIYIVRMVAIDRSGAVLKAFKKRITCIP
jgi:hypothetical protein